MSDKPVLLLDLDNTILDFSAAERVAFFTTMNEYHIPADEATLNAYIEINARMWELLERGEVNRKQVVVGRFNLLFQTLGVSIDGEEFDIRFEELLSNGSQLITGAEEFLKELVGNFRIYAVSNGTYSIQMKRIDASGIGVYFDDLFISEKIGFEKPTVEFFTFCFEHINNFKKKEALLVGDSLTSDIRGAMNCGIASIWYNPNNKSLPPNYHPTYIAQNMFETSQMIYSYFGHSK